LLEKASNPVQWSRLKKIDALDSEILLTCTRNDYGVFIHDLDFVSLDISEEEFDAFLLTGLFMTFVEGKWTVLWWRLNLKERRVLIIEIVCKENNCYYYADKLKKLV